MTAVVTCLCCRASHGGVIGIVYNQQQTSHINKDIVQQKKSKHADLELKRPLFMLCGLAVSLLLFFAALNISPSERRAKADETFDDVMEELQLPKRDREYVPVVDSKDKVVRRQRAETVAEDAQEEIETEDIARETETVDNAGDEAPSDQPPTADQSPDADAFDQPDPLDYRIVQQLPEFPGGMSAFVQWITANLHYPQQAKAAKIEGRVVLVFIVNTDGTLQDIRLDTKAHPLLDDETLRLAAKMPRWKPGKMDNKPCRTLMAVPIEFKL